jgi:small GTP-binding protein
MSEVIQKKICLLGEFAVGKTSLVRRFVYDRFDDKYLSTIGVKISRKEIDHADLPPLHLLIWDLAGGEDFRGAQANYLRGTAGALLVCDLTRTATLPPLEGYYDRLQTLSDSTPVVVLANKVDLAEELQIHEPELVELAERLKAPLFITSAKTGAGVEEAFIRLSERLFEDD